MLEHSDGAATQVVNSCKHTTGCLVTAVATVLLPVTQETARDAAAVFVTQMSATLHVLGTGNFIRAVLALGHAVTHFTSLNTFSSMGTLELVCSRIIKSLS